MRGGRGAQQDEEPQWSRLDPRTVLVRGVLFTGVLLGAGLPVAFGLAGSRPPWQAFAWVFGAVLLVLAADVVAETLRLRRTRYRVGPERVELRTGLLVVQRRSLARDRIRSADLTANPLQRLLGLVKVRIGTGEHTGGGESTLELDLVTRAEGERLRHELLARAATTEPDRDDALATLDPRWIRYAPVSFLAPAFGGAAVGAVLQVSEWFGAQAELVDWMGDRFQDVSVTWIVVDLILLATAVGAVGALALWVETWWNYRLEREPGGTLRISRGLLTTRSVSLEERRLRGVELVEPLGIRMCGAARVDAVATGLVQNADDKHAELKNLVPPVERAVADRVAGRILREPEPPTEAPLAAHPRAARTRRLRRALLGVLAPVVVLALLGRVVAPFLLYVAAGCAVVLTPLAVLGALDAYRALGHGVSGAYLVTRSGTLRRATTALQRSGVIGWTVKQSYFQRRAGLLTITATTAAGEGAYDVIDVGVGQGLTFAAGAVPDLLAPFLEPVGVPEARSQESPRTKSGGEGTGPP
ncbi:PH domain-containing protein [Streptomyces sp. NPDC058877]|uniref:PH domain-containing protein n=1 Tax=Streptomyces sp. NPDC058877 TaxID=3346665 RepID=UPI00367AEBC8